MVITSRPAGWENFRVVIGGEEVGGVRDQHDGSGGDDSGGGGGGAVEDRRSLSRGCGGAGRASARRQPPDSELMVVANRSRLLWCE